jgi:uncharacterized membrane protein required for colicin V production
MLLDDIYVMWIPILVVALMTALGAWRGVYREIPVSVSIVLSALIAMQWATQDPWSWARDLNSAFSGLSVGEWQFYLTMVLMALLVAVMGYGLGGLFSRRSMSTTARTLGGLLGLANGAALTGWVLRSAYFGLTNTNTNSTIYQNPVSQALMVWAGWFPVVLAVLGAVAALVYSLRGDRSTAIETTRSGALVSAAPTMPVYIPDAPAHGHDPYRARTDVYSPSHAGNPPQAPMSQPMPNREASAYTQTAAYPVVPPHAPASPISPRPATVAPHQAPPSAVNYAPAAQPQRSVWEPQSTNQAQSAPSSAPSTPSEQSPLPSSQSQTKHTPPFGYDLGALWAGSDEEPAHQDAPISAPTTGSQPAPVPGARPPFSPHSIEATSSTSTGSPAESAPRDLRCRNCGASLQEGAIFCTDCGTRV